MSLGVELGRGRNGMNDDIEEIMLDHAWDNDLTTGVSKRCVRS